jgi:Fe-S-cluster containining protein
MVHQLAMEIYAHALKQLESSVWGLQQEQQQYLQCKQGCSSCCTDAFRIRYVEARILLDHITPETRQNLQKTSEQREGQCVFLVNQACSVYRDRPMLCRAYGLILKAADSVGTCPLNYQELVSTKGINILDMQPFYELLDELSTRLWQADFPDKDPEPPLLPIAEYLRLLIQSP